jgi:hypothetical protein
LDRDLVKPGAGSTLFRNFNFRSLGQRGDHDGDGGQAGFFIKNICSPAEIFAWLVIFSDETGFREGT